MKRRTSNWYLTTQWRLLQSLYRSSRVWVWFTTYRNKRARAPVKNTQVPRNHQSTLKHTIVVDTRSLRYRSYHAAAAHLSPITGDLGLAQRVLRQSWGLVWWRRDVSIHWREDSNVHQLQKISCHFASCGTSLEPKYFEYVINVTVEHAWWYRSYLNSLLARRS